MTLLEETIICVDGKLYQHYEYGIRCFPMAHAIEKKDLQDFLKGFAMCGGTYAIKHCQEKPYHDEFTDGGMYVTTTAEITIIGELREITIQGETYKRFLAFEAGEITPMLLLGFTTREDFPVLRGRITIEYDGKTFEI